MNATELFIDALTRLKEGELGLLRKHVGQGLDETVEGFDLFTGIWWPLRSQKHGIPPKREVAWLVAKLYAFRPLEFSPGDTLAKQLAKSIPRKEQEQIRFVEKFDQMLSLPVRKIETGLLWALDVIAKKETRLDWVRLAEDFRSWNNKSIRLKWSEEFTKIEERKGSC